MHAWNNWFHVVLHTYGTWLRGDPRGWRARHHREHVEGDYKNPPPRGKYDPLHEYSRSLMKRDAVRIDEIVVIEFVLEKFRQRLDQYKTPWAIASFDGVHLYCLMQCNERAPRIISGIAKQYATAQLRAHGLAVGLNLQLGQSIWAKRSKEKPIADAEHYDDAFNYIHDHALRNAIVLEK